MPTATAVAERPRSRIDGNVSDLFFNLDFTGVSMHDRDGQFTGYDEEKMKEQAKWFVDTLERCGGGSVDPDDLIADFYDRV